MIASTNLTEIFGQIDIYMFDQILRGRRHLLPDATERHLVDEALLLEWTNRLGAALLDPLKTPIVQNQRCMTTWAIRKLEK